jgi:GT2 family glycosyltransferase
MNLGARHAYGAVLLFLHADTVLPTAALDHVASSLSENGIVGGGFARRYDSDSWFLRTTCLFADLRTRWTGWFLGDQAIFVRAETFEKLAGFRDLELFEDLDFSIRMTKTGKVTTLNHWSRVRLWCARGNGYRIRLRYSWRGSGISHRALLGAWQD